MIDPMILVADTVLFPALVATAVLLALGYSLYGWLVKYQEGFDPVWHFYANLAVTAVALLAFVSNGLFRHIYGNLFTYLWSFI